MAFIQYISDQVKYAYDLASRDFTGFIRLLIKWGKLNALNLFYRPRKIRPEKLFAVVCQWRTGSNFLLWLLDSHPNTWMISEPYGEVELKKPWIKKQIQEKGVYAYVERLLLPKAGNVITGIKLVYNQLEPDFAREWGLTDAHKTLELLESNKEIKIIHLKRRNKLKTLVSNKTANVNRTFILFNDTRRGDIQVEMTADECEAGFRYIAEAEERYDKIFAEHNMLEVFYEELTEQTESESRRIQDFLGLGYRPLKSMTLKQNTHPLTRTLINYADLKRQFADTKWAVYFE